MQTLQLLENKNMIRLLKDTAQLLELHGANAFQVRYYQQAALHLEKVDQEVAQLSPEVCNDIAVRDPSARKLIQEMLTTGTLQRWEKLVAATPQGVRDMLTLRGIGPKKVRILWQTLGVESLSALSQACEEGRIAQLPGFGEKMQHTIHASIAFKAKQVGKFHYANALSYAAALEETLQQTFPQVLVSLTGAIRRKMEVVDGVDILIGTTQVRDVMQWLDQQPTLHKEDTLSGPFTWRGVFSKPNLKLIVRFCNPEAFYQQLILHTGSQAHLALPVGDEKQLGDLLNSIIAPQSEAAIYAQAQLPYIPPELREGQIELAWAREQGCPKLVTMQDLRGALHNHTTYSDGQHSLEEMARHAKSLGYEYIGITDHSKNAAYAGGLTEAAILQQHAEIDALNQDLAPFKIFKGIESDILADGRLDYSDDILARFDFVIASVHTGLNMNQQQATERVIKAIRNPHTTILAHLTSRLLLKREGFPVDYRAVIDACAADGVIIEINANPWRLELDWRWVAYALRKNVWISVNPDAHNKASIQNMYYGVCVGRKGGLVRASTFNGLSCQEVMAYWQQRKARASQSAPN